MSAVVTSIMQFREGQPDPASDSIGPLTTRLPATCVPWAGVQVEPVPSPTFTSALWNESGGYARAHKIKGRPRPRQQPRKFEDAEPQGLLDEDFTQAQQELASAQSRVNQTPISKRSPQNAKYPQLGPLRYVSEAIKLVRRQAAEAHEGVVKRGTLECRANLFIVPPMPLTPLHSPPWTHHH
uniref:Uncharacterized protein n=1 Tax=Mesocestoides corti TaxID=53468 RepID=A0A5K3FS32_MESCO